MPDYKRKHRSRFSARPKVDKKKSAKSKEKNEIKFDDGTADLPRKKRGLTLVKGNKTEIRQRWLTVLTVALCVVLAAVICEITMPAGIIETVSTAITSMGTGDYPIVFESTNTDNVVAKSGYYYVLTDGEIKAVTNGGKVLFTYGHGFENPVIKTSKTRAIVFNQGGQDALIFTISGLEDNITSEKEIINAAIGDDGTYALVTNSDGYVAQVSVYKKNGKSIYEWYSASDMINNVAVFKSGKKIAISTLKANISGFDSKVMILSFNSANAEFQKEYVGEIIYNLSTEFSRGLSVATSNTFDFLGIRKFESIEYKNEYNLQMLRESSGGTLLLYNRENDKTDNIIVAISKKGEVSFEAKFSGIVTDIAMKNNHIYCISDTKAYILDSNGEIVRTADCGFGAIRLSVVSQDEIAVVTDNQINKVKFSHE